MATRFKIETGVPIPASAEGGHPKYPYAVMEVGHSFFVPATDELVRYTQQRISGYATMRAKTLNRKFITRRVEGGVRVWRVA